MPNSLAITGVTGDLRWGYLPAGVVERWTVTHDEAGWTLTAPTVKEMDTFRLSQQPIVFVAPHAQGVWRWPLRTLQIVDGTLSASLGPPE